MKNPVIPQRQSFQQFLTPKRPGGIYKVSPACQDGWDALFEHLISKQDIKDVYTGLRDLLAEDDRLQAQAEIQRLRKQLDKLESKLIDSA